MVSQRQMQACQREVSSDAVEIKTTRAMSALRINHWDNPHQEDMHLNAWVRRSCHGLWKQNQKEKLWPFHELSMISVISHEEVRRGALGNQGVTSFP